ncbi:hypothetical protein BGZ65_012268, partial [Modicella reniformis]
MGTRLNINDANRTFVVVQGGLYQGDRPVDRVDMTISTDRELVDRGAEEPMGEISDSRIAGMYYYGLHQPEHHQHQHRHRRADSEDTSLRSGSIAGGQFYHLREGSHSDPELSCYGPDPDYYHKEPDYVIEQVRGPERPKIQYYKPAGKQQPQQPQQPQQHMPELQPELDVPQEPAPPPPPPPPPPAVDERVQSEQGPGGDPNAVTDPIVAHYNQLHQRQKQEEQRQQRQKRQQQSQQSQPPQRRYTLLRRNSLESLDSDSSGGFRMRAVGSYERNNYGYGPATLRSRPSRYQRAYRYQIPPPKPASPARFYRFPEDREIYEQRK